MRRKSSSFTQEEINDIIKLYSENNSLRQIGRIIGCCYQNIKNILLKNSIKIRNRNEQLLIVNKSQNRNKKLSNSLKGKKKSQKQIIAISKANTKWIISKEYLIQEYQIKKRTTNDISKDFGCDRRVIGYKLKIFNIPRRKTSQEHGYWKGKKIPSLTERNLRDNPSKRPEVRKKRSEMFKNNPQYQVNSKLRRDKITFLEKNMFNILCLLGFREDKDFVFNKNLKTADGFRFPDFRFLNKKVIIECDGSYWHTDKEREIKRDLLLNKEGYKVYHFTEKQINNKIVPVLKEILCQ